MALNLEDPRGAAKAFLRIETATEDAVLDELVLAACQLCEAFTGLTLITRAAEAVVPVSRDWAALPLVPVCAITAVTGLPAEGAPFVLPVDAYAVDIDGDGGGWVRVTRPGAAGRVRVSYDAGLAEGWDGIPVALRQGIVRLIAHLFTHRDGARDERPPAAVTALWRPWRRLRLNQNRSS